MNSSNFTNGCVHHTPDNECLQGKAGLLSLPYNCLPADTATASRALDAAMTGVARFHVPTTHSFFLLVQVDAVEAQCRAQTQQVQHEWEQRLEAAIASLKAKDQAKMYAQEVRIEQLTQRLAAVETGSRAGDGGNGASARFAADGGDSAVSQERVMALITSVELLRRQISDLETQISAVSARRTARTGALDGSLPDELDKRLRDVERGQQQSLLDMEDRLTAQTGAAVERCARTLLSNATNSCLC